MLAEGGWLGPAGFSFRMRYLVVFEQAIAEFDLGGHPPLRLTRDGQTETVALEPLTGYDLEIRHLLDAIAHGKKQEHRQGKVPDLSLALPLKAAEHQEKERQDPEIEAVLRVVQVVAPGEGLPRQVQGRGRVDPSRIVEQGGE